MRRVGLLLRHVEGSLHKSRGHHGVMRTTASAMQCWRGCRGMTMYASMMCPLALVAALRFVGVGRVDKGNCSVPLPSSDAIAARKQTVVDDALRAELQRLSNTLASIEDAHTGGSSEVVRQKLRESREMRDAVLSCAVLRAALERLSQLGDADHDADVLREAGAKIDAGTPLDAAEGILTAAHPALARALAGASAWTKRVSMVLERESRKVAGVTSRMLYLAAFRLPRMLFNETAQVAVIHNVHLATDEAWKRAATLVMDMASCSVSPLVKASETFCMVNFKRSFLPVDFFSDCDLAVILLGSGCTAKIAPGAVLPEDVQSQAMAVAATPDHDLEAIRKRLFIIGLHRYEQWMRNQSRRAAPGADPVATGYDDILKAGKTPDDLSNITDFLSVWDVGAKHTSLEGIIWAQTPIVGHHKVLMSSGLRRVLLGRLLPVDETLLPVLVLPNEAPTKRMTHLYTQVVTGESGSGKTLSLLALSSDPDVLCIYMTAREVLSSHGGDLDDEQNSRNARCVELLSKALRKLHPALLTPLVKRAESSKKRAVIIVDEAGANQNLVRAMCSRDLVLDVKLPDGMTMSFAEYLGVAHVQLVVAGTGVSVMKEKCGSSPDCFVHVSVKAVGMVKIKDHLAKLIDKEFPWLKAVLSREAARDVDEELQEAEKNPRMHACIASQLTKDPTSSFASEFFRYEVSKLFTEPEPADSASRADMAIRQVSAIASIVAELKRCLASAKALFKSLGGLAELTLYGTQYQIFYALAFSCLRWDSDKSCCLGSMITYGILDDNIIRSETSFASSTDVNCQAAMERLVCPGSEGKTRCVKTMLYGTASGQLETAVEYTLPVGALHRYSVSGIHLRLALSIVGIEKTVWPRLGFGRIIMDLCYLHTMMALSTTAEQLSTPRWFTGRELRASQPSKISVEMLGATSMIREMWPKTVTSGAEPFDASTPNNEGKGRRTPKGRQVTLLERPKAQMIAKKVLDEFDVALDVVEKCTNVAVHKRPVDGELFNDTPLDPLRLLKAKLWSLAREHSVGGRVLVMKTQLPLPGDVSADENENGVVLPNVPRTGDATVMFTHVKSAAGKSRVREDSTWPRVKAAGKWKTVIPTGWLLRALEHAVSKEAADYFTRSGCTEVPVIALAMLYEDAPGTDGVIAYGTCRRCGKKRIKFEVKRLMKLQMKCHQQGGERLPSTQAQKQDDDGGERLPSASSTTRAATEEQDKDSPGELLRRMGKWLSNDHNDLTSRHRKTIKSVDHHVIAYDDERHPLDDRRGLEYLLIDKDTAAEAVHPLSWTTDSLAKDPSTHVMGLLTNKHLTKDVLVLSNN